MKKESVFASLLGVVMGIGVGLVILNTTGQNDSRAIEAANRPAAAPKARPADAGTVFRLTGPNSETTVSESKISITGKGKKDSLVVIQSPSAGIVEKLESDDFSLEFPLALGENVINVTYYPKDAKNDIVEKQLRIFSFPE